MPTSRPVVRMSREHMVCACVRGENLVALIDPPLSCDGLFDFLGLVQPWLRLLTMSTQQESTVPVYDDRDSPRQLVPSGHEKESDLALIGDDEQDFVEEKDIPNSPIIKLGIAFTASKAVCIVEGRGSGFLAKFDTASGYHGQGLMTNNHVLNAARIKTGEAISLDFEIIQEAGRKQNFEVPVTDVFVFTCPVLDVCFIEMSDVVMECLQEKTGITKADYLQLCRQEEKLVYVIHHPRSGPKCVSCGKVTSRDGFNLHYDASTNEGSSGSPLMHTTVPQRAIGIHKASGGRSPDNFNVACSVVEIIKAINRVPLDEHTAEPPKKLIHIDIAAQEDDLKGLPSASAKVEYASRYDHQIKHLIRRFAYSKLNVNDAPCWVTPTCHGWYYTFHEPDRRIARQHWISVHDKDATNHGNVNDITELFKLLKLGHKN